MSPVTFRYQVSQLAFELNRCILLCRDIRANRNLGTTHEHLDRFQTALESAESSIPTAYEVAMTKKGSEMEIGDEKARSEMHRHISDIQSRIKPKLKEIARPSRTRSHNEREKPGFRDLLRQWNLIYEDISETIISLSRRITAAAASSCPPQHFPVSTSTPAYSKPHKLTDQVTISLKEFDFLLEQVKNSWEEVIVGDEVQYVNVFDKSRKQWVRPVDAYIKKCPRAAPKLSRRPSFERRSGLF